MWTEHFTVWKVSAKTNLHSERDAHCQGRSQIRSLSIVGCHEEWMGFHLLCGFPLWHKERRVGPKEAATGRSGLGDEVVLAREQIGHLRYLVENYVCCKRRFTTTYRQCHAMLVPISDLPAAEDTCLSSQLR